MDEETLNILKAYEMTFARKEGKLVMTDLEEAYIDNVNPSVMEQIESIPHPYQEYVLKGMRIVVQNIKAATELAKEPVENDDGGSSS